MSCILSICLTLYLRAENKRREALKPEASYTWEEKVEQRLKGDNATFFRYTV